jgi:hypothetical protein
MTTTVSKVDEKWETKKVQEESARIVAVIYRSAFETLSNYGPKALEEFETTVRKYKIEHYKTLGVRTPLDLVRAIAETEHNVFGSQIEICGDDMNAVLRYNSCGMWEATQKLQKMTVEQREMMTANCKSSYTRIAGEFGFRFESQMDHDSYTMTFSR